MCLSLSLGFGVTEPLSASEATLTVSAAEPLSADDLRIDGWLLQAVRFEASGNAQQLLLRITEATCGQGSANGRLTTAAEGSWSLALQLTGITPADAPFPVVLPSLLPGVTALDLALDGQSSQATWATWHGRTAGSATSTELSGWQALAGLLPDLADSAAATTGTITWTTTWHAGQGQVQGRISWPNDITTPDLVVAGNVTMDGSLALELTIDGHASSAQRAASVLAISPISQGPRLVIGGTLQHPTISQQR